MKSPAILGLAAVALVACAPGRTTATTAPAPARPPASASSPSPVPPAGAPHQTPPPTTLREAPPNWQLLDETADRIPGIGAERAYRELLAGRTPRRTVIVAVIDGGVDTAHADLRANLWTNPGETPGNHRDDDGNGYADDTRGWNFIGGRDGRDVNEDTYELTRLYARCKGLPAGTGTPAVTDPRQCDRLGQEFTRMRAEAEEEAPGIAALDSAYGVAVPLLRQAIGGDSLTPERVAAVRSPSREVQQAQRMYLTYAPRGFTPDVIAQGRKEIQSRLDYGLNPSFDPRPIVGDDYANATERGYGNRDATGPDALHGTHVAGIIGAQRGNGIGIDGVAAAVRIMPVRAVPNGDERDKDIANAIRYAADNGASVINMSFGKGYSPFKAVVDDAVRYAETKGVLMVHAAGNDGEDNDIKPNYPTPVYLSGGRARAWIEVGASSWKMGDSLVASFSNYGHDLVDVFAPGVDILSTVPGGGYARESGTSMAAPVVSGLAALIMAYYPRLTAVDVKRIILASAARPGDLLVVQPGSEGRRVPFASLSATGGIVNAYNALRMAEQETAKP